MRRDNIGHAFRMAAKYYDEKTLNHALRVAIYVSRNELIPDEDMCDCIALALMHDLLENTEYEIDNKSSERFNRCLQLLTKDDSEDYIEYIKRIHDNANQYRPAYWVKIADMKDHLMLKETLTDKLKAKYLGALPYLL